MKIITDGTKSIVVPHGAQYSTPFALKLFGTKLELYFGGGGKEQLILNKEISLSEINNFLLSSEEVLEV